MLTSHSHGHDHTDGHSHGHAHSHGVTAPHPAQAIAWSILRMPVVARLAAAALVSAVLWGLVLLAMK